MTKKFWDVVFETLSARACILLSMSKKKKILLTGDDGYDSLGTRLLVRGLRDEFDLKIAGTKDQMSGVGGENEFGRW